MEEMGDMRQQTRGRPCSERGWAAAVRGFNHNFTNYNKLLNFASLAIYFSFQFCLLSFCSSLILLLLILLLLFFNIIFCCELISGEIVFESSYEARRRAQASETRAHAAACSRAEP